MFRLFYRGYYNYWACHWLLTHCSIATGAFSGLHAEKNAELSAACRAGDKVLLQNMNWKLRRWFEIYGFLRFWLFSLMHFWGSGLCIETSSPRTLCDATAHLEGSGYLNNQSLGDIM